ncbi:hypothetical protein ACW6QP_14200 [Salegentibacter sp. HM20]
MILFNFKELEKLLISGRLSDRLTFKYLFVNLIILNLVGYLPYESDRPWWSILMHISISLVAIIWGVRKTFEINHDGDNSDYFRRYISISFVAGVHTLVFGFLIVLVLTIIEKIVAHFISDSILHLYLESSNLLGFTLLNIIYYYILIEFFKRVNSGNEEGSMAEAVNA